MLRAQAKTRLLTAGESHLRNNLAVSSRDKLPIFNHQTSQTSVKASSMIVLRVLSKLSRRVQKISVPSLQHSQIKNVRLPIRTMLVPKPSVTPVILTMILMERRIRTSLRSATPTRSRLTPSTSASMTVQMKGKMTESKRTTSS